MSRHDPWSARRTRWHEPLARPARGAGAAAHRVRVATGAAHDRQLCHAASSWWPAICCSPGISSTCRSGRSGTCRRPRRRSPTRCTGSAGWTISPPSATASRAIPAQDWTFDWIERYGDGRGPGWTPDLTGRRLIRWINHAAVPARRPGRASDREAFHRSLGQQTLFLAKRWSAAPARPAPVRGAHRADLRRAVAQGHGGACRPARPRGWRRNAPHRSTPRAAFRPGTPKTCSRCSPCSTGRRWRWPRAGGWRGRNMPRAIERIAPTLRALRHADGGLARFHGGGRGAEGRLDQALATSGVRRAAQRTAWRWALPGCTAGGPR